MTHLIFNINKRLPRYSALFTLILVFIFVHLKFIRLDLWNDEIYTFKFFILKSYHTIVSDYHVPNNHILQSLIYKAYLQLWGINTLKEVMNNVVKLRALQLLFGVITLIYLYRAVCLMVNERVALLSVLVLITTIPYNNFVLQIRAYNISMMLEVIILYYMVSYVQNARLKNLFFVAISVSLLMYAVPSNLYVLLGIISFLGLAILVGLLGAHELLSCSPKRMFTLLITVVLGIAMSFVYYFPVFKQVFSNEYVTYIPFLVSNIKEYAPRVLHDFNSNRLILALICLLFAALSLRKYSTYSKWMLFILWVFMIPFLIVFVLGNNVPDRVFVTLVPFYATVFGYGLYCLFTYFTRPFWLYPAFLGLMASYLFLNLYFEYKMVDNRILNDIEQHDRKQDLYYNYYLAHFHPLTEMKNIANNPSFNRLPVVIVGCEPHDIPHYLEEYGMGYSQSLVAKDSFSNLFDSFLIVTNHPNHLITDSLHALRQISKHHCYHTFFLETKRKKN